MVRSLKARIGSILERASSIGARQALTDVSQRIDTFARLTTETTDFTREMAASSRRAHLELLDRLDAIERALTRTREQPVHQLRYSFLGGTTGLATVDHGHRLFVDTRDRQLTPHLITNGHWEQWNARLFRQILRNGDLVIDAGSNVGYFVTLAADLVGSSGHVYAFEANPEIARLLASSVEINGFARRVTLSNQAVSDRRAAAQFIAYSDRQGDGGLIEHDPDADLAIGAVIDVDTDTLDAMLPNLSNVRLMHFDIEGAEPAALRGARRIIETSPRLALLVEWGRRGVDASELRWLVEHDFELYLMRHTEVPMPIELADVAMAGLCDLLLYRGPLSDLGYDVSTRGIVG